MDSPAGVKPAGGLAWGCQAGWIQVILKTAVAFKRYRRWRDISEPPCGLLFFVATTAGYR
jgi:hypothetical protein